VEFTNVSLFMNALLAARNAAVDPLQPVPAHCLRIGTSPEVSTGDFNTYFPGTWPSRIFDPVHYVDVGYLVVTELGAAQDGRETLAGRGLYFDDWTPEE
jgi:hypothetical protein